MHDSAESGGVLRVVFWILSFSFLSIIVLNLANIFALNAMHRKRVLISPRPFLARFLGECGSGAVVKQTVRSLMFCTQ
jgi:hypothetical protein